MQLSDAKDKGSKRSALRGIRRVWLFSWLLLVFGFVRQWLNYGWWYAFWLGKDGPNQRKKCIFESQVVDSLVQKRRIGIVSLVPPAKDALLSRFAGLLDMTNEAIANKQVYADRQGYDLLLVEAETTPERPAPWSKLKRLAELLPAYDWLLYLDGDALVANADLSLELCGYIDDRYDIILSEDWGGYNTGVFLIKNSNFSFSFLRRMYDAATVYGLAKKEPWYNHAMPFEYEQRALHFFTRSETWRKKAHRIPQYRDKADAKRIRSHIKLLPQCALNSYLVRPRFFYDTKHTRAQFTTGDFVIHLAGHKAQNKALLFRYALDHFAARKSSSIIDADAKKASGKLSCGNLVALPDLTPIRPASFNTAEPSTFPSSYPPIRKGKRKKISRMSNYSASSVSSK